MIPLRDNVKRKSFGLVSYLLIAGNVYEFIRELGLKSPEKLDLLLHSQGVVPTLFWQDPTKLWTTLFTAMFLHGGWIHVLGNMLFLFVFGPSVEERFGHFRFAFFYIFAGMAANLFQAFISSTSHLPLIGASGAIAAILGAYFFLNPYAKILTLIPFFIFSRIVEIPAFIFLGFWFILQAFNSYATLSKSMVVQSDVGGVAWWAHAAGFMIGVLAAPALTKKKGR